MKVEDATTLNDEVRSVLDSIPFDDVKDMVVRALADAEPHSVDLDYKPGEVEVSSSRRVMRERGGGLKGWRLVSERLSVCLWGVDQVRIKNSKGTTVLTGSWTVQHQA